MIKELGLVVELDADKAMVQTVSKTSCHSCQVNSSCGTGLISKAFGERSFITPMKNHLKAQKGDQVEVGIPEDLVVKASLLVYLVPILSMIFATGLINWLLPSASEWVVISAAAFGLILGFLSVRVLGRKINKNKSLEPVLLRIVKRPIDVKQLETL